jgi:hypothetical protein
VLSLIRAQDLVNTSVSFVDAGADVSLVDAAQMGVLLPVAGYPFEDRADQAIAHLNGTTSLWDGVAMAGNGYFEGYIPSTTTTLKTKATRPNAFMLAALHRARLVNGNPFSWQINILRGLLLNDTTAPPNSNLLTVVAFQHAYFRASTPDFHLITGGEPHPSSYNSAAIGAAIEGLTEQLWGVP